ncbi:MAG: class I SAM-dependent methyltransferase [Candidatus Sulfotelmatobacter sp.]
MDGHDISDHAVLQISVWLSVWKWWKEIADRKGQIAATRRLASALVDFIRDSTPERRRQRYGDAEYDWEHRVNTTGGAISWRDRLLGVFHSPYQPTDAGLFHEMVGALAAKAGVDFREFVFIDLGSGKGRTLLMTSDYAFRRIVGVELLPTLNAAAQENIARYRSESQKCFAIESVCADATQFVFPDEPIVLFLFNPFPGSGLRKVIANLEQSLRAHPRIVYVLYHNPLLQHVLEESVAFEKICGTHQYSIYASVKDASGS